MNKNLPFKDKVKEVLDEIEKMLITKNESYGDSALSPLRIFSNGDVSDNIRVRIDDKLSRIKNSKGEGSNVFDEDTVLDLIGYLIILRIEQTQSQQHTN